MIRLVSAKRLSKLETSFVLLSNGLAAAKEANRLILEQLADARRDRDEWKARASRLLDQIGVSSGILSAPALTEPEAPPPNPVRQVFSALGRSALKRSETEAPPHTAADLLGVDEEAARAAIASL